MRGNTGRSSAKKGAQGERDVLRFFRDRGYSPRRAGTKIFGAMPDVFGVEGLHLEVKRCEKLQLPAWIRQSERDSAAFCDGAATVVFRQSGEPWRIVMRLEDFMQFYMKVYPPSESEKQEESENVLDSN